MAEEDQELEVESSDQSGGSKKKLIILILGGLLLVGGGVGGGLFMGGVFSGGDTQNANVAPEPDKPKDAVYISLEPAFTVNFENPGKHKFLQVTLEAMTRNPDMEEHVRQHAPMIRNKLLLLFGSKSADELKTRAGKEALQQEALTSIQDVLEQEAGDKGIEAVYFTSFVMQ